MKKKNTSNPNRPKIGLALGSGGARGLAHIGVLKVLEKNNIPVDFIAGSSIGALIGGFYATGLDIKEIERIALETDWRRLFFLVDPNLRQGLIGGEKVKDFIENHVKVKKFKDCKIPFASVATNLRTGEPVVFNKGQLTPAIRASISIPLAFKPVKIGGMMLADGGLSLPVPVKTVREMGAEIVIAVNVDRYHCSRKKKSGLYNIANDSLDIMKHHLSALNSEKADIIINVASGKYSWYDFMNGRAKILTGEKALKKALPELRKIIEGKR
jgi:NTE family protein